MPVRTQARFPSVAAGAGHYESFYIKAAQPGGGRALWLRHTVHKRRDEPPTAALWLTSFDSEAPGPQATKQSFPADELAAPTGAYIRVGEAILEPGRTHGAIHDAALGASWELSFEDGGEPLRHLPYEFLYRARLPRTKLLSPYPATTFSGRVRVGDEEIELERWPGMIGHNWGAEHAERWVWIQASGLGDNPTDYLDIAAGRIKLGPWTTPWVANGRIVIDGEPYTVGGLDRIYGTDVDAKPGSCEFTFPGKGVNVKGRIGAPLKDFVAWIYADPAGPEHNTLNCSVADIEVKVERPGKRHYRAEVPGGAAYELGMRESDHGVPLQPYGDP